MDSPILESITLGSAVHSADDEKLGTVAAIHSAVIHVEKGLFFVKDYAIPVSAIASVDPDDGTVMLNVSKDVALESGWEIDTDDDDDDDDDDDKPVYDSPVDGEGDRVLIGAAEFPSLPIIEELDEDDPPIAPAPA